MKLHIDKEADALYLRLDESAIVESEEVAPGRRPRNAPTISIIPPRFRDCITT